MDDLIAELLDVLRVQETLDPAELDRIVRRYSKQARDGRRIFAKKRILPRYLQLKETGGGAWDTLGVTDDLDRRFVHALQMKPRRSASGVATITVITKPWTCSSDCIYCPCDIRMPKSYLHDEPACQRAERNFFDPYLQATARLETLRQMGHATDKIELIVLGGSFTDYPRPYRTWFIGELFRALADDTPTRRAEAQARRALYRSWGMSDDADELARQANGVQTSVDSGASTFNEAFRMRYGTDAAWAAASDFQQMCPEDLVQLHERNETCGHRVVGLVVETRPDAVTSASLREMRALGCTKVQIGVQALDDKLLADNGRHVTRSQVQEAFALLRLFGFKTHAHFMVNLLGATPETDKAGYAEFVGNAAFMPDEVKLYPCALVGGTKLVDYHRHGSWRPYTEEELVDVLGEALALTPPFTRISRMIRDISAGDILAGNKKTNLRQLVEAHVTHGNREVSEIRFREISTSHVDRSALRLERVDYRTTVSEEVFLQWVDASGRIAGFLRLSLPRETCVRYRASEVPIAPGEAMIREVHVYGFATALDDGGVSAQHRGLGRALVEEACGIAQAAGYAHMNVISAVGTREYYRKLGFADNGLYQRRRL